MILSYLQFLQCIHSFTSHSASLDMLLPLPTMFHPTATSSSLILCLPAILQASSSPNPPNTSSLHPSFHDSSAPCTFFYHNIHSLTHSFIYSFIKHLLSGYHTPKTSYTTELSGHGFQQAYSKISINND